MMANVGKIRNQGIELLLSGTPIKTRDLRFDITGTFSYNKNKIISLSNGLYQKDYWYEGATGSPIQTHTHIVREGDPVGNFHGFQTHSLTSDGLWMVYGADGQPKLLTDADDGDKKVIGNGIPTTYGSLNLALSYKGFDVSVPRCIQFSSLEPPTYALGNNLTYWRRQSTSLSIGKTIW